jgi:phosphatidylglycerol---prolipoprotein diacylglyceryl transferase
MSFPYVTDLLNAAFGTEWDLPIPMFGTVVVTAIMLATTLARREVARHELLGRLPAATNAIVGDLALVSVIAGIVGARVFHILDRPSQFIDDPASMIFTRAGFSILGGLCFGIVAGALCAEAAYRLRITREACTSRVHRGRALLREYLQGDESRGRRK